jgi:hypothetical protein
LIWRWFCQWLAQLFSQILERVAHSSAQAFHAYDWVVPYSASRWNFLIENAAYVGLAKVGGPSRLHLRENWQ